MIKYIPSMLLIVMGLMDCFTTVIGTLYFGTIELNPLISNLVHTNITAFIILKITITITAGITFILAEKALRTNINPHNNTYKKAHNALQIAYGTAVIFLVIVVLNNISVLANTM
ncbi:MAG: DUF5658 family protein [Candidatus Bathyarchaeota archaeon]|nr:DUF5658 family protein [Candidatus Bathyarchaeota archaeon]